jgi:hypothetical protein
MNKNELVVNNGIGCYSSDMNNNISGLLYHKQEKELPLNPELQKIIEEGAVLKDMIETAHHNYKISIIDINKELEDFLNGVDKSAVTRRLYRRWLQYFLSWCDSKKIDCRKITRIESENYLYHLSTTEYKPGINYTSNSISAMVMSVCSFYRELQLRYPLAITVNPFHKIKLPKIKLERREDIVLEDDIEVVKDKFKSIGREDIVCVIDIFCHYGYRVGIFEKMKIDKEGNFTSVSKEQNIRGKFTEDEAKRIRETGLLKLRKCTLQNIILKYTTKLFNKGKIGCPFSVHDLRHYHIWKYGKNLTMAEFMVFSKRFHKNIKTTIAYMERYQAYYEAHVVKKRV